MPGHAIPILPCRSIDETVAFYSRLGFSLVKRFDPHHPYAIIARDGGDLEIHFFAMPALNPAESYGGCYLRVDDADALHRAFAAGAALPSEGIPRLTSIEDKPWGLREFAVVDPSGNLVRVGHRLDGFRTADR
jgi:catechol 2,3-dioxygenase-like lactoylglutathione lyase family enzyme